VWTDDRGAHIVLLGRVSERRCQHPQNSRARTLLGCVPQNGAAGGPDLMQGGTASWPARARTPCVLRVRA
jgi:hypothetical protein